MTAAPTPTNPALQEAIGNLLYDEIFNDCNPAERSTILAGVKEHHLLGPAQHLLEGLTVRDFQVLVMRSLDHESARLLHAYGRIQELRATAAKQRGMRES